ncbi:MAG: kynureninase [Bacteroidota bacterium]
MVFQNNEQFARDLDQKDVLSGFRDKFLFPEVNGQKSIYFTGNSLGLQPVSAREALLTELDDWAKWGVEGHFHAQNPWYSYHERFSEQLSAVVGAKPHEVVAMNALTVNLHLLMVSFFRPQGKRKKLLCEAKAFPSDQYAIESQLRFHGLDPQTDMIEVAPRPGEHLIHDEDIIEAIQQAGDELALVLIGGVNYYSGQVFDMQRIAEAAHSVGALCGFDLAHGAGNYPVQLNAWKVDFACWCSYKYLNSGPGAVSGIFVHEKHAANPDLPRFAGWWGHDKSVRFKMEQGFKPIPTAESWQLSNAPVFNMAIHKASLDLFAEAGMDRLRSKSLLLTDYLAFVIDEVARDTGAELEIITPRDHHRRGAQLSLLAHGFGRKLFDALTEQGVIADWREPNVIRVAPTPMYNSFSDVYRFGTILKQALIEN